MPNFFKKENGVETEILFSNGFGAYDNLKREYSIHLSNEKKTPRPWVNIISNPIFGTLVTETGASFTWYKNSYLYRLTPWVNDPIVQKSGEIMYLKDEITKEVWSPTPGPLSSSCDFNVRHGHGYSIFESEIGDLSQELNIFVHKDLPLKFFELTLHNKGSLPRKLSATLYVEWLLGDLLERNRFNIEQEVLSNHKMITAHNPFSEDFSEMHAFVGTAENKVFYCKDRAKFFGRSNSSQIPEMLKEEILTDTENPNDQCGVIQAFVEIPAFSERKILFYMGVEEANNLTEIPKIVANFEKHKKEGEEVWHETLDTITIKTPNVALDTLWNNQLLYQVLSSRVWGRVSFYQPGGAYGFRDQLQDVMALVWSRPDIARKHILLAAGRQFKDGSVQHWWHPPSGKGIQSESSDAHLWLVYVTEHYIKITGDREILNEEIFYLEKNAAVDDKYFTPDISKESEKLFDHLVKSIELTLQRIGEHNLPLILKGDWNDAMDKIGEKGRGESVWLAFFLSKILNDFHYLEDEGITPERSERYKNAVSNFRNVVNEVGWDGEWYKRAFGDEGHVFGSQTSLEAKIDSLSQSWSVISGIGDKDKAAKAMSSVRKHLIDREKNLTLILTPPFEKSYPDPGYIQTYPKGMRENGGSYLHAALWVAQAEAMLGNAEIAMDIVDMANPFNRTKTSDDALLYEAEPYILASDIYSGPSNTGRAGWTWYTGSAALYYITVLENILGVQKRGDHLFINPSVPKDWREFSARLVNKSSVYNLNFVNPQGVSNGIYSITLDNQSISWDKGILLEDDGKEHNILITLGEK